MNFSKELLASKTLNTKIAKMLEMLNGNVPVSRIEQVLMLDYTNQLHELINTFATEKVEVEIKNPTPVNIIEAPAPVAEVEEVITENKDLLEEAEVANKVLLTEAVQEEQNVIEEAIEEPIAMVEVSETVVPEEFKAEKIKGKLNEFKHITEPKVNNPKEEIVLEEVNNLFSESKSTEVFKAVTSIKSAIGLNERFAFVENLFNGNGEAFNQFVNQLDDSNTDAKSVLAAKAKSEKWEPNNEYFKYLKKMVHLD